MLISLCRDRVVLVLVLYLQGSANVFTEGRTRGCDPSQAASPVSFLHPMPCSGCQGGCRAESWHGAASQASRTSAPLLSTATLSAGRLHHNQLKKRWSCVLLKLPASRLCCSALPKPTRLGLCLGVLGRVLGAQL